MDQMGPESARRAPVVVIPGIARPLVMLLSRDAGAIAGAFAAILTVTALGPSPLAAQDREVPLEVRALRVEEGPVIDGVLNEEVWRGASVIDAFIQQEPAEGAPASERTEVRLLYTENNLYLGIRASDSNPGAIVATEMRRDAPRILDEDNFQIILDTFKDARSGYMFVITPLGARLDQQVAEEGEGGRNGNSSNINRDWDGVWSV